MSFWDDLTGNTAAEASRKAAGDTYDKQQGAVKKMLGYGDDYKTGMFDLSKAYDPYVAAGTDSLRSYSALLNDPSRIRSMPGYQFTMDEGTRAIDHSGSARSMGQSGRALKDLTRFGQGNADQFTGNWLQRFLGGAQMGQTATGQQVATQGQGLQGQLGARSTAYSGDYGSSGTIGQGDIAAANAQAAGSQNLLNTGVKLAGMAMGGGMGGGAGMFGASSFGGPSGTWADPDSGMGKFKRFFGG